MALVNCQGWANCFDCGSRNAKYEKKRNHKSKKWKWERKNGVVVVATMHTGPCVDPGPLGLFPNKFWIGIRLKK